MRVDNRVNIRTHLVDAPMKRMFRRGRMETFHLSIRTDPHDILTAQAPFIDASRRDPNVAILVAHRMLPPEVVVIS